MLRGIHSREERASRRRGAAIEERCLSLKSAFALKEYYFPREFIDYKTSCRALHKRWLDSQRELNLQVACIVSMTCRESQRTQGADDKVTGVAAP